MQCLERHEAARRCGGAGKGRAQRRRGPREVRAETPFSELTPLDVLRPYATNGGAAVKLGTPGRRLSSVESFSLEFGKAKGPSVQHSAG